MGKKLSVLVVAVSTVCLLLSVGCSNEDYEYGIYEEKNENHIPRLRSSSAEIYQDPYSGYGDIPKYTDECALYTLTLLKNSTADDWYNDGMKAEEYYNNLKSYAMENYDYTGGSMSYDTMYKLGKQFNLFENVINFSNNNVEEFFRDENNLRQIKTINMNGHTAKFIRYEIGENKVIYKDSDGTHSCYLNQIVSVFY